MSIESNEGGLANNFCTQNIDCTYAPQTGSCNTPEYVTRVTAENIARNLIVSPAQPRVGVTCTCENSTRVTHG